MVTSHLNNNKRLAYILIGMLRSIFGPASTATSSCKKESTQIERASKTRKQENTFTAKNSLLSTPSLSCVLQGRYREKLNRESLSGISIGNPFGALHFDSSSLLPVSRIRTGLNETVKHNKACNSSAPECPFYAKTRRNQKRFPAQKRIRDRKEYLKLRVTLLKTMAETRKHW